MGRGQRYQVKVIRVRAVQCYLRLPLLGNRAARIFFSHQRPGQTFFSLDNQQK